ncbi:MAG: hypothetical protein ACKVP0_15955 [Pirellulaceae bacterium]
MPQIEALSESVDIDGVPPVEGYRALSLWAMAALALGLLSGIAVFSPLLGIFPLAAIGVASYALWRINVYSDRLAGRWMAIIPLFLAPFFLGWGLSRDFSRREVLYGHAREFADDWVSLLSRKEKYLAHQLKVSSTQRIDLYLNMEVAYQGNEAATSDFKMFVEGSPIREILAAAPDVHFHFVDFHSHKRSGFTDTIVMRYSYDTASSTKTQVWITAQRKYSIYTGRSNWQIMEISTQRPYGS